MAGPLDVYLSGTLAGTIRPGERGPELTYTDEWVEDPDAYPLSLSLPLERRSHDARRTGRYLASLIPENHATLKDWSRRWRGVDTADPVSMLAVVGQDVAGAAVFVPEGSAPDWSRDSVPLSEHEVGCLVADLRDNDGAMPYDEEIPRVSLAGQQPKIGLYCDGEGWRLPRGDQPSTHILKPAPARLTDADINETAMLAAARKLGIEAARGGLEEIGGQRVFVVERFDRDRDEDGTVRRIHQEDLCQALGYRPAAKYQLSGGPALADVTELIRARSADPSGDLDCLTRLLAFNVAIGNSDAHAKNHGLLIRPEGARLAPAYDLVSVAAYPAYDQRLAFAVGEQYHYAQVDRDDWRHYARRTGQDPDRVLSVVAAVWEQAPDAVHDALERFGASAAMRDRILAAVDSVAGRLQVGRGRGAAPDHKGTRL